MRIQIDFEVTPYEAVAITQLNTIWEHISLVSDNCEINSDGDILNFAHGLAFALDGINQAAHGESAVFWRRLAHEDRVLMDVLRSRITEILAAL